MRLVRERLERAAAAAGRDPDEIRLIAVSKTFPLDAVEAGASAGLTDFGENRVQEDWARSSGRPGCGSGGT